MNNLNELNTVLFDTLRGVKDGTIDDKKAKSITGVSNAIINNAKLQLNAAKFIKGGSINTAYFGEISAKNQLKSSPENDLYSDKLEFAISMGYKNLADAISQVGKNTFEQKFKASKQ